MQYFSYFRKKKIKGRDEYTYMTAEHENMNIILHSSLIRPVTKRLHVQVMSIENV